MNVGSSDDVTDDSISCPCLSDESTESILRIRSQEESVGRKGLLTKTNRLFHAKVRFDSVEIVEHQDTGSSRSFQAHEPFEVSMLSAESNLSLVILPVDDYEDHRPPRRSRLELMLLEEEEQSAESELSEEQLTLEQHLIGLAKQPRNVRPSRRLFGRWRLANGRLIKERN